MTSKEMRGNTLFRRNEFPTTGKWQMPIIRRQEIDLDHIDLISYSDTRLNDNFANRQKGVHFFIDDYRFEGVYRDPDRSLARLSQYKFLLTPDYSTYADMNLWRQMESIAHSRWVGARWQDEGQIVVPTMGWGGPNSFDFSFDGPEKHCVVAVGMIGCKHSKEAFMLGYNEMLNRIDPEAIICYGKPFDEMEGHIIVVDYKSPRKAVI